MTISEIMRAVRDNTYGLLSDGEVVYAVQMALTAHGGIDPDDVKEVKVIFKDSNLDIQLAVAEPVTVIDMKLATK